MALLPEQVCAHRGASGVAPENTMAAFRQACTLPVGSVEFDISLLGDGALMVHHDGDLGRTIRATGSLATMCAADFDDLDAGSWFGPDFAAERVPSLRTVLSLLAAHDKMPVLDVKLHGDEAEAFAVALAHELRHELRHELSPELTAKTDAGAPTMVMSPLVTSFSRDFLRAFRRHAPTARLGLLDEPLPADWYEFCADLAIEAVHLDYSRTSPEDVAAVRARGLDVRFYTVNDPAAVQAHLAAGLTAVISDFPERFFGPEADVL